jgi:hypothetical protein
VALNQLVEQKIISRRTATEYAQQIKQLPNQSPTDELERIMAEELTLNSEQLRQVLALEALRQYDPDLYREYMAQMQAQQMAQQQSQQGPGGGQPGPPPRGGPMQGQPPQGVPPQAIPNALSVAKQMAMEQGPATGGGQRKPE